MDFIRLDTEKFMVKEIVNTINMMTLKIGAKAYMVQTADGLILKLEQQLKCRELKSIQVPGFHVEYPDTWFDAFKLRYYPAWMLRRWPACMKIIDREYYTIPLKEYYPGMSIDHDTIIAEAVDKAIPKKETTIDYRLARERSLDHGSMGNPE